jgi:hypothetical protein
MRWLVIVGSWLAVAALGAAIMSVQSIALGAERQTGAAILRVLVILPFWVAVTPVLLRAAERFPVRGEDWPRRLAGYVLAFIVFFVGSNAIVRLPHPTRDLLLGLSTFVIPAALAFAAIVAIGHMLVRPTPTHLVVADRGGALRVPFASIDWLEAEDNYVLIHTQERSYTARQKIGEVESQLDARQFVRVHRSAIVRVAAVQAVKPLSHGDYEIQLARGTTIRGSRSRRAALERLRAS